MIAAALSPSGNRHFFENLLNQNVVDIVAANPKPDISGDVFEP